MAKEKGRTETVRRMTLAKRAVAELEEKKSIFIGNAAPVRSEDEARAFIEEIRHVYGDATHNVYAYLLDGGAIARFSDAGEPHGTAGMPALNVLKMAGATDLCVVVTRYFGGILLGAGGLVRAYSQTAKLAVDAAGFAVYVPYVLAECDCGYADYQKLTAYFPKWNAAEEDAVFTDEVRVRLSVPAEKADDLYRKIAEATGGRAKVTETGREERLTPVANE